MTEAPRAILLTGPVGSGKTTVLHELDALLVERDEPYALVDLDWLAWVRAPGAAVHVLLAENLSAVWSTFRAAGVTRLVLARMLGSRAELESLHAALAGVELAIVRLDAPRDVLEERIHRRDSGRELDEHLRLLATPAPELGDATVDATRAPREVARDVLARAGW